ncbi:RNA-directed DNA polymerase, eukaryota, nucleotide-binding alpha-beta plait domain protein [Tanacetum coccineum]
MMAIGTGHRSNNYSESKRNDHLDNNRRQEQRNKGIPNKSHPNFREEHKSFSSIFVSNIPWNASVQDICNKWGVVIDVYIAAKRSKSGHRFAGPGHNIRWEHVGQYYGTCNAGAESVGLVLSDVTRASKNMFLRIRCVGLDMLGEFWVWLNRLYGQRWKAFKTSKATGVRCLWHNGLLMFIRKLGGRWGNNVFTDMVSDATMFSWKFAYCGGPTLKSIGGQFLSPNTLERKDAEGPSLDERMLRQVIALKKRLIIAPHLLPRIDSDKRWSYRDPNGNIHGLFSLAQLRSWKDYFPSDLQIWSYYGNVKEAILLHNAYTRQTIKDAG